MAAGSACGVMIALAENDPQGQANIAAFRRGLQELGWTEGRNIRIDYRFADGDIERMRVYAAELVDLAPDVILVHSNPFLAALRKTNRTIPTVFAQVADPVGSGFVESLARPGGNVTGFSNYESEMGGKWLEALKEIAPRVTRAAVLLHPETTANVAYLRAAEAAAAPFGVTVTARVPTGVHLSATNARYLATKARRGAHTLDVPLSAG